jgi:hypothetical protein
MLRNACYSCCPSIVDAYGSASSPRCAIAPNPRLMEYLVTSLLDRDRTAIGTLSTCPGTDRGRAHRSPAANAEATDRRLMLAHLSADVLMLHLVW